MQKGPLRDAETAYQKAFRQLGIGPDNGHVLAWDPAAIIVEALRHRGINPA
jgi:hypothetical protein